MIGFDFSLASPSFSPMRKGHNIFVVVILDGTRMVMSSIKALEGGRVSCSFFITPFDVFGAPRNMSSIARTKDHTAHHDVDLKYLPLGGVIFNGKFHEGRIEVFHHDFPNLPREVEKVEAILYIYLQIISSGFFTPSEL